MRDNYEIQYEIHIYLKNELKLIGWMRLRRNTQGCEVYGVWCMVGGGWCMSVWCRGDGINLKAKDIAS